MPTGPTHPLTDQHYQLIQQSLTAIADYRRLQPKMQAVGLDTSQHDAMADQMEERLKEYKKQFFGRVPKGE
jgi:hypothetical protein